MSNLVWKRRSNRDWSQSNPFHHDYSKATSHQKLLDGYDLRGLEVVRGHGTKLETIVNEAKQTPCLDCGGKFKPHQMHFDHIDGSAKLFNISQFRVLMPSEEVLQAEMAKCEIVCANCHADRTMRRNDEQRKLRAQSRKAAEDARRRACRVIPLSNIDSDD